MRISVALDFVHHPKTLTMPSLVLLGERGLAFHLDHKVACPKKASTCKVLANATIHNLPGWCVRCEGCQYAPWKTALTVPWNSRGGCPGQPHFHSALFSATQNFGKHSHLQLQPIVSPSSLTRHHPDADITYYPALDTRMSV